MLVSRLLRALRRRHGLTVWAALTLAAPAAFATEPRTDVVQESARALADEGANAYAAHDYERALALFQRAYLLVPAPTIALFEARTLARLGRLLEARAAYARLVRDAQPDDAPAPFRNAVDQGRAELAELEARIPRLKLVVTGKPRAGSAVLLDGRPLSAGLLRGPLLVDPGAHSLELRTAHGAGASAQFIAAEGQTEHVRLVAPSEPAPDPRRTWSFVALGVGGAGLTLGLAAGAVALSAHEDAERGCPQNRCAAGSPGADAAERFRDFRTVSTVGYVVGAVGVGAGITLFLTSRRKSGAEVAVLPALGGGSVVTRW